MDSRNLPVTNPTATPGCYWVIAEYAGHKFMATEFHPADASSPNYPYPTNQLYDPLNIRSHCVRTNVKQHFTLDEAKAWVDKMNAKGGLQQVSFKTVPPL